MKRLAMAVVCASVLATSPAFAQLEFEADKPRIFSIQPREHRLGHEFQLGIGIFPLDAFNIPLVINAGYTYHFTDFWAWEIANAGYGIDLDTGLEGDLEEDFGVLPARGGGEKDRFFASTGLVIKPLFGKLAIFNEDIIFSETFLTVGVGPFLSVSANGEQEFWRMAVNVGLGLRFWSNDAISFRIDIRDYLIFKGTPTNGLLFNLSASLNVYDEDFEEEPEGAPRWDQ